MRYGYPTTFTDKCFYALDTMIQWGHRLFRTSPNTFIDLNTVSDASTCVMRDGTLVTAVKINGTTRAVLDEEMSEILDIMSGKMSAYMGDGCHYYSFYFSRDKTGVREELERTYGKARSSTRAMGLDFADIIDEQISVLERHCFKETCLLLLYTTFHGLSREERDHVLKRQVESEKGLPRARSAQQLAPLGEQMQARHSSFVDQCVSDLTNARIDCAPLDTHSFLRLIRYGMDPEWTAAEWEPILPGDPLPKRINEQYNGDYSSLFWPSLKEQLIPRGAIVDGQLCTMGDRSYAPLTISFMPKQPEVFQSLFLRLNREGIPWRIHQLCRNDGMGLFGFNETLATVLSFSKAVENSRIIQAKRELAQLREAGEEIVQIQITLCTWAAKGDTATLEDRRARLARCVQGWGVCEVAPVEGDPLETTMCSLPAVTLGSVAEPSAAPIYDTFKMAPLSRPASAWNDGSQPMRSADGKLMHFEPYSPLQAAWVTLIFGPMGSGKSVWMNYCNLSLIMKPDLAELPMIGIIDVGPSSRGLISLVRSALPNNKKHLAMYARLMNTQQYAINVFDTPLGLRRPLTLHANFLVNFLTLLATPDSREEPIEGTKGFLTTVVDLAYKKGSSFGTSVLYQPMVCTDIDRILNKIDFDYAEGKTTWWDVVDELSRNSMFHEATLAQRYAVPTLGTLVMTCVDENIKDMFGSNTVKETSESLPNYMYRRLTDAMNTYPILSGVTQFDLGEARIVSLDLDEVAKGSGSSGKRSIGVMYMLAYHTLTSKYFFTNDHLGEIQVEGSAGYDYRPYHRRQIDAVARLPKRLCIDEKHRVSGIRVVEEQMDIAIREGRKMSIDLVQSSQVASDFSSTSVELATNVFILGAGTSANVRGVIDTFQLNNTMSYHLRNSMRKPGKAGSTVISISQTDTGYFEHFLYSSQGPTFLWATNTTRDDCYVRDKLGRELGEQRARKILVKKFPSGSLQDEVADRKRRVGISIDTGQDDLSNRSVDEGDTPLSILDSIADELIDEYSKYAAISSEFDDQPGLEEMMQGRLTEIA